MNETRATVKAICLRFMERASELEYKGKKRDSAALDYIVGAAVCAQELGNDKLANHLAAIIMLVSVRGYAEVAHIATKLEDAA